MSEPETTAAATEVLPRGDKRLSGRVALVTGASRGIGRAIAQALAAEGAPVALAARSGEDLERLADDIRKTGGEALPVPCDVSRPEDIERATRSTVEHYKRVDVLINNAGIGKRGKLDELTIEDWDRTFAVNLRGVFLMTQSVVPHMKRQGSGHIINISSVAGLVGNAGISCYNATKFGLMGFSEALMFELRHDRIKVTTICPGSTDSYFSGEPGASNRENFLTVDDVAHAVAEVVATAPNALISQVHLRPLVPPQRG